MTDIAESAWLPGLIGSLLFTVMLLIHHFFGPGPDIRDEEGKRAIPPEYRSFVLIEFTALVSMLLLLGVVAIIRYRTAVPEAGVVMQIGAGYAVLWIINLWDLVVIDWALVVRFRPRQIELPDLPYFTTMKPHVLGWLAGNVYVMPFAGIAYLISTRF